MSGGSGDVRRGQPLIVLAAVALCWGALRIATWSSPLAGTEPLFSGGAMQVNSLSTKEEGARPSRQRPAWSKPLPDRLPSRPAWEREWQSGRHHLESVPAMRPVGQWTSPSMTRPGPDERPSAGVVGHNLSLMAGLSQIGIHPDVAQHLPEGGSADASRFSQGRTTATAIPFIPVRQALPDKRWSADVWAFIRGGSGDTALAPGQPSYGRSQAGGVVRYDLVPGGRLDLKAHLRGSSALQGPREREVAVGMMAQPIASVPVRAGYELRVRDDGRGTELRPAVLAVSEFPPLELAGGARAEAYVQGGYVAGDFATAFVDGQARVTVDVTEFGDARLSAGGGVWGGAQKAAARIDVGPSAALTFRMGEGYGRLAADYRLRVAGDAEPGSGPALTLSAGF